MRWSDQAVRHRVASGNPDALGIERVGSQVSAFRTTTAGYQSTNWRDYPEGQPDPSGWGGDVYADYEDALYPNENPRAKITGEESYGEYEYALEVTDGSGQIVAEETYYDLAEAKAAADKQLQKLYKGEGKLDPDQGKFFTTPGKGKLFSRRSAAEEMIERSVMKGMSDQELIAEIERQWAALEAEEGSVDLMSLRFNQTRENLKRLLSTLDKRRGYTSPSESDPEAVLQWLHSAARRTAADAYCGEVKHRTEDKESRRRTADSLTWFKEDIRSLVDEATSRVEATDPTTLGYGERLYPDIQHGLGSIMKYIEGDSMDVNWAWSIAGNVQHQLRAWASDPHDVRSVVDELYDRLDRSAPRAWRSEEASRRSAADVAPDSQKPGVGEESEGPTVPEEHPEEDGTLKAMIARAIRTATNGEGPFVGSIRDRQKQLGFNAICRDCRWIGRHWGTVQEARFDADMHATIKHDDDDWQYRQETLSSGQLDRLSAEFRTSSRRTAAAPDEDVVAMIDAAIQSRLLAAGYPEGRVYALSNSYDLAYSIAEDGHDELPPGWDAGALWEVLTGEVTSGRRTHTAMPGAGMKRRGPGEWEYRGCYLSQNHDEEDYEGWWEVTDIDDPTGGGDFFRTLDQAKAAIDADPPAGYTATRKTGSLWDAIEEPRHVVAGWNWDDHLAGYVSEGVADFACKCGSNVSAPGQVVCACGKFWNSYQIASKDGVRLVCREVPVRENVLLAHRKP